MNQGKPLVETLAAGLYAAATTLGEPLLRRKLARRAVAEPGYAEAVEERFGRYAQPVETARSLVWVHAVSLGETRTAAIFLRAWREQHPGLRLLLTHGTATGRSEGRTLLEPGDIQVWQPWDSPAAAARFMAHFRPRLGVLLETEVWPGLMIAASRHAVPVVLVNARLSDKSYRQASRLAWLARPAYRALKAVYAQTEPGSGGRGIAGFVVDGRRAGFIRQPGYALGGQHTIGTGGFTLDGFIASEFQRHFLLLGLKGGIAGGVLAMICFVVGGLITRDSAGGAAAAQLEAMFGGLSVGLGGYLGALAVVSVIAILTALTSRVTVRRYLSSL
jgi:hypothetical protein